jgi:hypothetical protein
MKAARSRPSRTAATSKVMRRLIADPAAPLRAPSPRAAPAPTDLFRPRGLLHFLSRPRAAGVDVALDRGAPVNALRDYVLPAECRTPPRDSPRDLIVSRRSSAEVRPVLEARSLVPAEALVHLPEPPIASIPVLDRVRSAIAARHYSRRTEKAYLGWIRRFMAFYDDRPADEMGETQVTQFLSTLASRDRVSAGTQNQALSALIFLYREVLGRELRGLDALRAKPSIRVPVVLSREEVVIVLRHLRGTPWLMMSLMYGSGLRLLECARLRIKDLDFDRNEITVRDGARAGRTG